MRAEISERRGRDLYLAGGCQSRVGGFPRSWTPLGDHSGFFAPRAVLRAPGLWGLASLRYMSDRGPQVRNWVPHSSNDLAGLAPLQPFRFVPFR